MRTIFSPAEGYPIAIIDNHVHIPDFQMVIEGGDFAEAVEAIHVNLRNRKLNNHYFPFPSSIDSIVKAFPEAAVMTAPTIGWENPGPLAPIEEE